MLKYQSIASDIQRSIEAGALKPNAKLPTVVELCEAYGVSKITIKRAIDLLTDRGLISSRRGSGTYVKNTTELLEQTGLEPIAFACIFYGAAFLVCAAAVLALQQLSQASDSVAAYGALDRLGAERPMVRASIRSQVAISFAVPGVMACVHCVFGFVLIGVLTVLSGSVGYLSFVAGTVFLTAATFAVYGAVTSRACSRTLLPQRR